MTREERDVHLERAANAAVQKRQRRRDENVDLLLRCAESAVEARRTLPGGDLGHWVLIPTNDVLALRNAAELVRGDRS